MEGFAGAFGATIVYPIDLGMSLWMLFNCYVAKLCPPVVVKVCRALFERDFDRDPRLRVRRRGTFLTHTEALVNF
jgi:hypothetical protein